MCDGAPTVAKTLDGDSNSFEVKVGLHQGSLLSLLPFIIVSYDCSVGRWVTRDGTDGLFSKS